MFGYVTVYENLLSSEDYSVFKEYYCGLCKATGKNCSQPARLGLSYDITFLAIMLSSLEGGKPQTERGRCAAHPFSKRKFVINDRAVAYSADVGVLLEYYKLLDDREDDGGLGALVGMCLLNSGMKKALRRNPEKSAEIKTCLDRLRRLEKANSADIDECADCFAKILETLFVPDFIENETRKKVLKWFGYNIGRWIYVIDAVNDMEKDYKKGNYNPFNAAFTGADYGAFKKKIYEEKEFTLTYTLSNAAAAFDLLDIEKNKSLLEGIVYKCLPARQKQILGTAEMDTALKGRENGSI